MMDRKISADILHKKKLKFYFRIAIVSGIIIMGFVMSSYLLKPSIQASAIDTVTAQQGTLEISIGATGTVVPLYEEVITSPIATKILNVYKKAGEDIQKGDTILQLDLSSAKVDFQADQDDIKIKKYQLEQYEVTALSELKDLEMQVKIDEMKLKRMETLHLNEFYLDSIGASTKDKVKQSKLEYEVALLQFEQLKLKVSNLEKTIASNLKVYELNYNIALNKFSIKNKMLGEAQIISPRNATLSWVNDQIGANIDHGAQLAILSDLSQFKVNAEISDSYAGKFFVGNHAEIKIGNKYFTGSIANIIPAINNGRMNFTVLLDDNSNEMLRSGLKVDIYVINSIKTDVTKISNRSYYSGPGEYYLWIVNKNVAEKRIVQLGECSASEVEVLEGIDPGETVIVSNMNSYRNKHKLQIR